MVHHMNPRLVWQLSVEDVAPYLAQHLRFVVIAPAPDCSEPVGYGSLESELHVPNALVPRSVGDQVLEGSDLLEVETRDVLPVCSVGILTFQGLSSDTNSSV